MKYFIYIYSRGLRRSSNSAPILAPAIANSLESTGENVTDTKGEGLMVLNTGPGRVKMLAT